MSNQGGRPALSSTFQAVDPIAAVDHLDAVSIVGKAGELAIEGLEGPQIAQDRTVRRADGLPWHEDRNPWGIGDDPGCHAPSGHGLEWQLLDRTPHQPLI